MGKGIDTENECRPNGSQDQEDVDEKVLPLWSDLHPDLLNA